MPDSVILIGYSGHAYVVADCLKSSGYAVEYYCEQQLKEHNPYELKYLGTEKDNIRQIQQSSAFVAIGANEIRKRIMEALIAERVRFVNAIHSSSIISKFSRFDVGILVAPAVVINSMSSIGKGSICNTGSIIEHECQVGDYVHIGPGAVICGDVKVENGAFIGANAVIRQGLTIGENAVIGAGAVVVNNISPNSRVLGNPAKLQM